MGEHELWAIHICVPLQSIIHTIGIIYVVQFLIKRYIIESYDTIPMLISTQFPTLWWYGYPLLMPPKFVRWAVSHHTKKRIHIAMKLGEKCNNIRKQFRDNNDLFLIFAENNIKWQKKSLPKKTSKNITIVDDVH